MKSDETSKVYRDLCLVCTELFLHTNMIKASRSCLCCECGLRSDDVVQVQVIVAD